MSVTTWIEDALAGTSGRGTVVIVQDLTEVNLRWANNALTTNGQMHSRTASVIAIADVDSGIATGCLSGPITSASELVALVSRATELAASSSPGEDPVDLVEGVVDADYTADAEPTSIEVLADLAAGLGRAFDAAREADHLLFGFAEHHMTTTWLATSTGVRRRAVTRMGRLELNAKHPDMIGSAWVGRTTQDFTDVDMDEVHAEVMKRLAWCETRLELPAGRYETILPPSAVSDLMIYAYWTMNGRDAREGRNVFAGPEVGATRVGQVLSKLPVSLWSDPAAPGLPTAPFAIVASSEPGMMSVFDNGADARRVDWITDGTLTSLIETRAEWAKSGGQGLFPFPTDNLLCDAGGDASIDEMVASTKRGLLLTCLWYIREVDPQTLLLTGLTRDGVYLVEDGHVVGMVNNF
ncbi:MAG TPA: metallopeptidase TldD-related protein, partial [Propionibacteriaceae bacterium]|nr:metallopeptidase TldD-related protein [Propionibacteriaceae bacterium]